MKRPPVLHPFLFPLFPILALYAHNIRSIPVPLGELAGPLAVSLAAAAILFFSLSAVLRVPAKAGLVVSVIVLWLLSFGHLAGWVTLWTEGLFNRSLFFATALLVGLTAFLIVRSRRDFAALTRVLNVVATTLVLLNVGSAVLTLAGRTKLAVGPAVKITGQASERPNIYYIVFDAYTRADILREIFDYDNTPFLSALESRNFSVASRSYANYNHTHQSLASSLNFTLLDDVVREVGTASADHEPLFGMIQNNRAMAFLKSRGYRLVTVSSSMEPTDFRRADRYFGFAASTSEFLTVFLNTTPWPVLFGAKQSAGSYDVHRRRLLNAFRALERSPQEKGPFLMFAHIMAPHPPFVFGPRGEPVEPDYFYNIVDGDRLHGGDETARAEYIVRYRDQLAYLNILILAAVDAILKNSARPPVIILQGDHGSRVYMDFDRPEASYFKENLAILNAYHLPGGAGALVHAEISPVNTFRLIFKHYFGADIDFVADKSFWCTWRRPYRFIPFDERTYRGTVQDIRAVTQAKPRVVRTR